MSQITLPCFIENHVVNDSQGIECVIKAKCVKERKLSSADYKTYQINLGTVILGTITYNQKEGVSIQVMGMDNLLDYDTSLTNIANMLLPKIN